jgi:hypothetical protein
MEPETGNGGGGIDITALLAMGADDIPDDNEPNPATMIMPYLQQYGMITKSITVDEVTATDLRELSIRWNLRIRDKKSKKDYSFDKLLNQLVDYIVDKRQETMNKAASGKKINFETTGVGMAMSQSMPDLKPKKFMKLKNFFGMPDYAYDSNPDALVYASRKTRREKEMAAEEEEHHEEHHEEEKKQETKQEDGKKKSSMVSAQRKVSEALMTMVDNEDMAPHFMHKGGVEAVIKLLSESDDSEVLTTCTQCLLVATETPEYCKVLNDKHILSNLQGLLDKVDGDFDVCLSIARTITNMSYQSELGEFLVMGGIVAIVQGLFVAANASGTYDLFFFCMLTMNNVGPTLSGPDAELCLKILMSCAKKLDVARHYDNALFAIDIFVNFTRNFQYHSMLLEEGVLSLFIHTMEAYLTLPMMGRICEGFVNLSCTRKNRREIASSGIAGFLDRIFSAGAPEMRAHILSMIGNLLSSGFFHDKIARDDAIKPMLGDMLSYEQPKQFTAVAFVISQLAQVGTSATVMVRCGAVRRILDLIEDAPSESKRFLWTVLAALSQQPKFFDNMTGEENGRDLIKEMFKESMIEDSEVIELVVQLAYNLAQRNDLGTRFPLVTNEQFVALLKMVFVREPWPLKETTISTLINFTFYTASVRVEMLGGGELVSMFEEVGIDNPIMNIKYAACLNICSNEPNLCIKMLEAGAQKFLVAIQSTITAMPSVEGSKGGKKEDKRQMSGGTGLGSITGELGRALTAATLHNLSLKRATLGPGTLTTLMRLLKNNKTLRVLHGVRMLARVSVHPKSKLSLTKERTLIPLLTAVMRSGCEEADRVQHYCGLTICNTLACQINREIMEELIVKGAITDLVVCTLLRINSVYTKENLGKALFNLMARADFRETMVIKLDVLTAMLELAKIENLELLELCIRSCYNVSCEYKLYAPKLKDLKLANILVARATHSPLILGAKATTAVKALCGMAMANMSFDHSLAEELVFDKKVADACMEIFKLDSNEATYCAAVTLLNMSVLPDAKNLADSKAIPLCVYIIEKGPVECLQMAVATLCNFSMLPVFFDQLTANAIPVERANGTEMTGAIPAMVGVLATTVMDPKIRLEALQFLYNISTKHSACWPVCVQASAFEALGKILKSETTADGKEPTLFRIGRITKELCTAATTDELVKKMLADGVNSLILKLAKVELVDLKFDLACAIYSLSRSPDKLRVLQADGVDILYWLTVHDCLGHNTPVRRNISRALRNFTACGENGAGAISLSKEERAVTVMKALQHSENEDVQWQLSGSIYNMLQVEEAQEGLLEKGVVGLLLELAGGGYTSVRHVCSACLHMCPSEYMPDLSDPAALSLVLCLLEVDGEKFGELAELAMDEIPYILSDMDKNSLFHPDEPPFKASWVAIACEVDAVFSPALISFPSGSYKEVPPAPPSSASTNIGVAFKHFNGTEFFFGGGAEVDAPEMIEGAEPRLTSQSLAIASQEAKSKSKDEWGDAEGKEGGLPAIENGEGEYGGGLDESGRFGHNAGMGAGFDEDSSELLDAGFAAPERSEDIAYPKIFSKASLPNDTVGAIYSSNARDAKKQEKFPARLASESIATNDHMNLSSTISRK